MEILFNRSYNSPAINLAIRSLGSSILNGCFVIRETNRQLDYRKLRVNVPLTPFPEILSSGGIAMTNGMTRKPRPSITIREEPHYLGYGPRVIKSSRDQRTVFIGCKDKTITEVSLGVDPSKQVQMVTHVIPPELSSARSLLELESDHLLIGDELGQLACLRLSSSTTERIALAPLNESPPGVKGERSLGALSYLDRLWGDQLLISFQDGDTFTCRFSSDSAEISLYDYRVLEDVQTAIRIVQIESDSALAFTNAGEVWKMSQNGLMPIKLTAEVWRDFDRPGFLSDSALVLDSESHLATGIYVSTDTGIFYVSWPSPTDTESLIFKTERVSLPGVTRMCVAIAYVEVDKNVFLWAFDLHGDTHLFWRNTSTSDWRRLGIRQGASQVLRAVAVAAQKSSDSIFLVQALRSNEVRVATVRIARGQNAADFLSRRAWSRKLPQTVGKSLGEPTLSRTDFAPEAWVATFIEAMSRKPQELSNFLGNPEPTLAASILKPHLADSTLSHVERILALWTCTILGSVHRRIRSRSDQHFMGVIQWLRNLEHECLVTIEQDTESTDSNKQARASQLHRIINKFIYLSRKWGIYGSTYQARRDIVTALRALDGPKDLPEKRKLDRLVYQTRLFRQQSNLIEHFRHEKRSAPWKIEHLRNEREELVAVSWRKGGISIFEKRLSQPGSNAKHQYHPSSPIWQEMRTPASLTHCGPSRAVVLGRTSLGSYLVYAPSDQQRLKIFWLESNRDPEDSAQDPLPDGESVFSMLRLDKEYIALGLQGVEGRARIAVARIVRDELHLFRVHGEIRDFSSAYPETHTEGRNPVWALAQDHSQSQGAEYTVIVGCNDGQIWHAQIRLIPTKFRFEMSDCYKVASVSSAVWAISCRTVWANSHHQPRIVAGCADGTIICYQRNLDQDKNHGPKDQGSFSSLWATHETPVSSVHITDADLGEGALAPLVLCLTREGKAILFSDILFALKEDRPNAIEPNYFSQHKADLPGARLGRIALGSDVFASNLVETAVDNITVQDGEVAQVLIGNSSGGIEQIGLHYPKHTRLRRSRFHSLVKEWHKIHGFRDRFNPYLLRTTEATFSAVPELSTVMVRQILPTDPAAESYPWKEQLARCGQEPIHQWMPLHLHPLVDLEEAWSEGRSIRGKLKEALLAAREIDDRNLFKELLSVALIRANRDLFLSVAETGTGPANRESAFERFLALSEDLDEVKDLWWDAGEHIETKLRIVQAKNLLDGETLWALSGTSPEARSTRFQSIIAERGAQIQKLLSFGSPLLALETLRAANLALIRACRRLSKNGGHPRQISELPWESIRPFYLALGDFAARASHSGQGGMTDPLSHEVSRAYGLGIFLAPSAVVLLTNLICEVDLPHGFTRLIDAQITLLKRILSELPVEIHPSTLYIYRRLSGLLENSEKTSLQSVQEYLHDGFELSSHNRELLEGWSVFENLVLWLNGISHRLANEAGDLERHLAESELHLKSCQDLHGPSGNLYRHSKDFWTDSLNELVTAAYKGLKPTTPNLSPPIEALLPFQRIRPQPVKPALILFSVKLSKWANKCRLQLALTKAEHRIFEPQKGMYEKALSGVAEAAQRFSTGAAVQKNLVLGVLGHGLLELLDEHLLELWEIAYSIDPIQSWEMETTGKPLVDQDSLSVSTQFSQYLISRAHFAESIPKNLRNLQGLLAYESRRRDLHQTSDSNRWNLLNLLSRFSDPEYPNGPWLHCKSDESSGTQDPARNQLRDERTFHFLHLALEELGQNHKVHGHPSYQPHFYRVISGSVALKMLFPYCNDETVRQRIEEIVGIIGEHESVQTMFPAFEATSEPSHGSGLYLATLAAAAVGWRLGVHDIGMVSSDSDGEARTHGLLEFTLSEEEP